MIVTQFLDIHPLTKSAFAPFGDVIEADPETVRLINNGTTERFHALAAAEAAGDGAGVIINLFRGQPRAFPYDVGMMERHPLGSQSFSPMSGRPFVVVVSEDEDGRPGRPKAFFARGDQGDFIVVDRDGPGNNLEEYVFETPFIISEPSL
jgi:ureidoglycolate lyase